MQLGMIGLGRMGGNMVLRLMKAGHECFVYDRNEEAMKDLVDKGAKGRTDLKEFVGMLARPRAVWLMVPAAAVDKVLDDLTPLLESGDIVVDGGNSYYHDDIRRAAALKEKRIQYVDVGVSGGVWGLERGYCMMIGGEAEAVQRLDPIFKTLAPGVAEALRTPGRNRGAYLRRERLSALRPQRRRAFCQNGPQRHRIRNHGSFRRRAEHSQEC